MAPPPKPIARARSEFFGEPEPAQFFPPSPALKTMSPFGQYDSPALLGEQMTEREDILSRRNKLATELAGGAYQRQSFASQGRILPYSEQLAIASAQLGQQQAVGSMENLPQAQEARRVSQEYDIARARQGMQEMPEQAAFEQQRRNYEAERMASDDPYVRQLQRISNNPRTFTAYESFAEDPSLAKMPAPARRKAAYVRALQLEQDQEAVDAIDTILQTDPNANAAMRGKYVEPVFDPVTKSYIGEKIKDDADRMKVSEYIAKAKNQRRQMEIDRQRQSAESRSQKDESRDIQFKARMASNILENPDLFDKYSPEEQEQIREAVRRGVGVGGEQKAPAKGTVMDLLK
jgi:hypothetical protein